MTSGMLEIDARTDGVSGVMREMMALRKRWRRKDKTRRALQIFVLLMISSDGFSSRPRSKLSVVSMRAELA